MSSRITILMPVFNAAPFLRECLDSVIAQSEKGWQLCAVDDFSTDKSYDILCEYAEKDKRIISLKNDEKGIIAALRIAYKKADGDFLTRMDADDKMPHRKLELLKKTLLTAGENHVATGLVRYFSDAELGAGYQRYEAWLNDLTVRDAHYSEIYKECVIPSPAWLIRRADFEKCGAFDFDLYPEDYDLCFRFYENKMKIAPVQEIVHLWRDHSGRTSRNDETYANNAYFNLKLPYFLRLEYDKKRPLVLWGAGKKGKTIARFLEAEKVPFDWICNNKRKWGLKLFSAEMHPPEYLRRLQNPQIIIAVAAPDGRKEILQFMQENNLKQGVNYRFFC